MRRLVVETLFSYGQPELTAAARRVGLRDGDSVMIHSAFEPHHGFTGSASDAVSAFRSAVGPTGNVLMVSLPYHSATIDYLAKGKVFDVRRTPSAMGLVSECFRRQSEVVRSLHPTHPVLAAGPDANWLISDHERALAPCGPASPFGKLVELDGKVLFFNVSFSYMTFFHYLEDRLASRLPFPIYCNDAFEVPVVAADGSRTVVRTLAFNRDAIARRRIDRLEAWARQEGLVQSAKVGASKLTLVSLRRLVSMVDRRAERGEFIYDFEP